MPRLILLVLLFSAVFITCGGPVYSQEPPEDPKEVTAGPEAAPEPEAPKQISTVMVEGHLLSVEFVDVNFGEILKSISKKAGFRLEGHSVSFSKKVTTKFTDVDIDKGLVRLFSLVNDNNYLISYDAKGSVSKVRVSPTGTSVRTPAATTTPTRGPGLRRRGVPRPQRPVPPTEPQPQPEETEENQETEEDSEE